MSILPKYSIILPIHNKGFLIESVISGILNNTATYFELIVIFDGCTDNSEEITKRFVSEWQLSRPSELNFSIHFYETPNIFEVKSNNFGAAKATGDYLIFMQDDVVITEKNWNISLCEPFVKYCNVFAVSGNCAHNWQYNPNSSDVHEDRNIDDRWSDILIHTDHANKHTVSDKDAFVVRSSCNRAPLAINRRDFEELGGFDEIFFPLEFDDHDLMYRAKNRLEKVCGYKRIGFECRPEWGGTRDEKGNTKPWVYAANQKNAKIFYSRHKDSISTQTFKLE